MSTLYQWFLRPDTFPILHWPEPTQNGPSTQDWSTRWDANFGIGTAKISTADDHDPAEFRLTNVDTIYYWQDEYARWSVDRNLFANFKISIAQGGSLGDRHLVAGWIDDGTVDLTAPHNNYGSAGDALFFEINTGIGQATWFATAIRNGAVSRANTGSAPRVDGAGETLKIVYDGVNATFYIDGVEVAALGSVLCPRLGIPMKCGVRGYTGDPGATGGTFNGWDLLSYQTCYGGSP
ncbi:MAG: hypothetical protein ACWGQW_07990 [bacterium]